MDDPDHDGRWMTYAELADARGIDRQSARRMANRTRWRRQKDNHGVVRVYVPMVHVALHRRQRDMPADMPAVISADLSNAISALQGALASVEKRAESAERRAEQAEKLLESAESARILAERRADDATARADGLRDRVDGLQAEAELARVEIREAQQAAIAAERTAEVERVRADEEASRASGLDNLLVDAEHRLAIAEDGRRLAQERADTLNRAEIARQGRGVLARLRATWRGE